MPTTTPSVVVPFAELDPTQAVSLVRGDCGHYSILVGHQLAGGSPSRATAISLGDAWALADELRALVESVLLPTPPRRTPRSGMDARTRGGGRTDAERPPSRTRAAAQPPEARRSKRSRPDQRVGSRS